MKCYESKITSDGWIWPPALREVLQTFEGLYQMYFKKPDRKKPLLIMGETGVGKSAFVDLFENNCRQDRPRITVKRINIAAIPDTLIEGELFGHKKGAYTGATKDYPGIIGILNDGDLLILEEIGELKPYIQVKLLTFIEGGIYYRLHNPKEEHAKNIQIVGTTNKDPQDENIRKDFFHRFTAFHVLPLRNRTMDIYDYARQLCPEGWDLIKNEYRSGYLGHLSDDAKTLGLLQNPKKPKPGYTDAEREFLTYSWPGNVRELINVLEMLTVISHTWPYRPVSNAEKQRDSFLEMRREAKLYEAIKNAFALHDPLMTKIALRVLAPNKETKKRFLSLWEKDTAANKTESKLSALENIFINGPEISKDQLLKTYFTSLMERTGGKQNKAAKLSGLSPGAFCGAWRKYGKQNQ